MWSGNNHNNAFLLYSVIAINVIYWVIIELAGSSTNVHTLSDFGAIDASKIYSGQFWRFFSAMFIHIGPMHLIVNTISIFIIGSMVNRFYGSRYFLLIYLVSGLSGSLGSYAFISATTVGAGASGAVFGCLGALLAYFFIMRSVLGEFGRQNLNAIGFIAILNLGFGFIVPGVDNWAHLGGLASGFLLGTAFTIINQPYLQFFNSFAYYRSFGSKYFYIAPILGLLIFVISLFVIGNIRAGNTYEGKYVKASHLYKKENFESAQKSIDAAIEKIHPNIIPEFFLLKAKIALALGDTANGKKHLELAIYTGLPPNDREEAITLLRSLTRNY